jgi:peptide-methionine (S)-S-oxide reductase
VDFDPERVAYADLLDAFWLSHDATRPSYSTQYASLLLAHDEKQLVAALESRDRFEARTGRTVSTRVEPLRRFWLAEDYHQKYRLRSDRALVAEFHGMYPADRDLQESAAAARVNGCLGGGGSRSQLEREIGLFGLSAEGRERLMRAAGAPSAPA